ncbi:MAG: hypothetical protein HY867_05780 [Chloroflexi bacterium]|nr:hypothetical protein [Chloroflexota bacterium]
MKFDFGEALGRMWKIGWNHKILWVFQMLPMALYLLTTPVFIFANPAFSMFMPEPYSQWTKEPWAVGVLIGLSVFLLAPMFLLTSFSRTATTLGAIQVDQGAEKLSFRKLSSDSLPYLFRIAGMFLLFMAVWVAMLLAFMALMAVVTAATMGIGMLCMMPMFFILYPILFVGYIVMELTQTGIIADDLGIRDALAQGWRLFRSNILTVSVYMLILYFGMSILSSIFIFPMMAPMMAFPLSIDSSGDINQSFFVIVAVAFPLMMVFMSAVQGIFMTFFQAAWAVAYRRLTSQPNQPIVIVTETNG